MARKSCAVYVQEGLRVLFIWELQSIHPVLVNWSITRSCGGQSERCLFSPFTQLPLFSQWGGLDIRRNPPSKRRTTNMECWTSSKLAVKGRWISVSFVVTRVTVSKLIEGTWCDHIIRSLCFVADAVERLNTSVSWLRQKQPGLVAS